MNNNFNETNNAIGNKKSSNTGLVITAVILCLIACGIFLFFNKDSLFKSNDSDVNDTNEVDNNKENINNLFDGNINGNHDENYFKTNQNVTDKEQTTVINLGSVKNTPIKVGNYNLSSSKLDEIKNNLKSSNGVFNWSCFEYKNNTLKINYYFESGFDISYDSKGEEIEKFSSILKKYTINNIKIKYLFEVELGQENQPIIYYILTEDGSVYELTFEYSLSSKKFNYTVKKFDFKNIVSLSVSNDTTQESFMDVYVLTLVDKDGNVYTNDETVVGEADFVKLSVK